MNDRDLKTMIAVILLLIAIVIALTSYLIGFTLSQAQCFSELRAKDFQLINKTHYLEYYGDMEWKEPGI